MMQISEQEYQTLKQLAEIGRLAVKVNEAKHDHEQADESAKFFVLRRGRVLRDRLTRMIDLMPRNVVAEIVMAK